MIKIKPILTLITAVLLCMNLQTPTAHSTNITGPTMMTGVGGNTFSDLITADTLANIITALGTTIVYNVWQNREYIYDGLQERFASCCGWCFGNDSHPLDSIGLNSLPENLAKALRKTHDRLVKTKGVVEDQKDNGDWLYQVKESTDPDAHTYRSYSFSNIVMGFPGAVELFANNVPAGKFFNKGRPAEEGEIYQLLNATDGGNLIRSIIGTKDSKLTENLLSGYNDWYTGCNVEIVKGGNTHYIFLGSYLKTDGSQTRQYTPKILFKIVAGAAQTSDIFDEEGKLTFDITYGLTKQQVFTHYYGEDGKGIASQELTLRKRSARGKKKHDDLFKVELDDGHKTSGKKSKKAIKKTTSKLDSETEELLAPNLRHPSSAPTKKSRMNTDQFNAEGDDMV